MNQKPYPTYKPSGVAWLGAIPEHWEIRRLKRIASTHFSSVDKHTIDGEIPVRLCNYTDVYYNSFITSELEFMPASATFEEIRKFALKKGDVIVTKDSEDWNDIAVGAYVRDDIGACLCGYHLAMVRALSQFSDGRYLFHAFAARGINDQFRMEATGITRYGLAKYSLDNAIFLLPPVEEQLSIASFLDRETARIDGLIEKKQRQIELLQEKRTALISHAVTKGLNPNATMKDSGIEWLGEVPAHWEVAPLYTRYQVQLGKMLDSKQITGAHLAPYLRNIDVQWGAINIDDLPMMDFSPEDRHRFSLRKDDLLVCEGGEVGRSAVWSGELEECFYQKALHRLRPLRPKDSSHFFYYALFAAAKIGAFAAGADASTIGHLTGEKLRRHRFAFPNVEEQSAITTHLDKLTADIDTLNKRLLSSIATLREYRTALISAAVTGKIDVR